MIYYCEVCKIEKSKLRDWIIHYHTEKHKNNLINATHTCTNCQSTFVYKKTEKSRKVLENHFDCCKKNVNDKIMNFVGNEKNKLIEKNTSLESEINNKNDIIDKLKEENINLRKRKQTIDRLEKRNIKLKEENKNIDRLEKENLEFKIEIKELKTKNELLNNEVKKVLFESSDKVQKALVDSNTV